MVNATMLVHNRPRLTKQALWSLGNPDGFNIFILNHHSDEETSGIVNTYCESGGPDRCSLYCDKEYGTGTLRNIVIEQSEAVFGRADYLYLSDCDCFFYPAIFEKIVPVYEAVWKEGFKVLAAYNHPYHLPISTVPIFIGGQKVATVKEVQAVALQSMLMRWEVWDKYGPFEETPPGAVCMGEDVSFCHKILADGGRLGVIDPPLVVNTGITNSFGQKIPGWELVLKEAPLGVIVE